MKILIVDDDPNTVHLIEDSIPWEEYGISEIFSAYHGLKAMEIVEEQKPDIIVSDIEMPQMDGIKLLETLAEKGGIMPEFIFLTCHESFAFAQKAIHYGVSDYLLKPFSPDELTAVLASVVIRCRRKKEEVQIQEKLKEQEKSQEKNRDYLVQNFIRSLLHKVIEGNTDTLCSEVETRNIPFDVREKYYIVYAGVNINNNAMEKLSETEFYFVFRNLSTEVMYDRVDIPSVVEYVISPYYILVILVQETFCGRQELEKRCQRLNEVAAQYLKINLTCIVSKPVLPESFADSKKNMDKLFQQEVSFHSKVVMYGSEKVQGQVESGVEQEEIVKFLYEGNKAGLIVYIKNLLQKYERESKLDRYHMQAIHHDMMQIFYGFLYENHIQAYRLFQDETSRAIHAAAEYSPMDMIKYVNYMYDCSIQQLEQMKEADSVIARVEKYIKQHFAEQIDRDAIAASVFLAPNYLSKLFREETGMNLREYINVCRIEEAKKLMSTTNISITNIAIQVGFENIPYFSTVFKKYCDMTPAAWKGRLGKQEA